MYRRPYLQKTLHWLLKNRIGKGNPTYTATTLSKEEIDNPEKLATLGTQDEDKQNTMYVRHHYTQTNTNKVNKTRALLQTTGGKDHSRLNFNDLN